MSNINFDSSNPFANSLLNSITERINAISNIEVVDSEPENDDEFNGQIWQQMKTRNQFEIYTNFTEQEILEIWHTIQPHISRHRKRGPLPKINWEDSLLLLLAFYRTGSEFDKLALCFNKKPGAVRDAINRMKPILNDAMKEKWWDERPRVRPLLETNFPYIGLIGDTTSVEVLKPKGRFEEAKYYWDEHNKIYALKKEVAIMAASPHYALFSQKGEIGSRHDYSILKTTYTDYVKYLRKHVDEMPSVPIDMNNPSWAMLFDKAYIGPPEDTLDLRRITPKKNPQLHAEKLRNKELNAIRGSIERFFGRMEKLWGCIREIYRWDHDNFDVDFDNCLLLTNEHIKQNQLEEIDRKFHLQVIEDRRMRRERKEQKRKQELELYKQKKKFKSYLCSHNLENGNVIGKR